MTSKLDMEKLFPPAELAKRRERWDRFWRGDASCLTIICPHTYEYPYQNILDRDRARAAFFAHLEAQSRVGEDYLPAFNCIIGTCALASAFGGEYRQEENGLFWIKPIIEKPEDVYRIACPSPLGGLVGKAVDIYHHVLDGINGYIPPRVPDMQGPLNTASMLWRQEDFILAMYDHPAEVHHLLSVVTDYMISVYRHFLDTYKDTRAVSWPFIYMPHELGVGMTEDLTGLLSPDLYREFGLPYVNRVSRAFGGIYIHCCGRFKAHWPVYKDIENLRGLDTMHPYTHPAEVTEAFPDIVHTSGLDYAESVRNWKGKAPDAFTRFLLSSSPPSVRKIFFPIADATGAQKAQVAAIRGCRSA